MHTPPVGGVGVPRPVEGGLAWLWGKRVRQAGLSVGMDGLGGVGWGDGVLGDVGRQGSVAGVGESVCEGAGRGRSGAFAVLFSLVTWYRPVPCA